MKNRKRLKLAYRGYCKFYQNPRGQYLVGVNMGIPFVIPIISKPKYRGDVILYIPDNGIEKDLTRFVLISDGSYNGTSIIDLDTKYIIYESTHNNTLIKDHTILEKQIELNALFLALPPKLMKEVVKENVVIRIFRVGMIATTNKFVYINDISTNKDYYPKTDNFDFRQWRTNHNIFLEFVEKEKCFVVKNHWKIEFI